MGWEEGLFINSFIFGCVFYVISFYFLVNSFSFSRPDEGNKLLSFGNSGFFLSFFLSFFLFFSFFFFVMWGKFHDCSFHLKLIKNYTQHTCIYNKDTYICIYKYIHTHKYKHVHKIYVSIRRIPVGAYVWMCEREREREREIKREREKEREKKKKGAVVVTWFFLSFL